MCTGICYSDPVTKIIYTYNCIKCHIQEDQINDSVKAALQTMNLKQYQGEVNPRKEMTKDDKVCGNCT